jgi:hypothetical protein
MQTQTINPMETIKLTNGEKIIEVPFGMISKFILCKLEQKGWKQIDKKTCHKKNTIVKIEN